MRSNPCDDIFGRTFRIFICVQLGDAYVIFDSALLWVKPIGVRVTLEFTGYVETAK